jgi:pimeloyl-[acyl-carrier protein] methyl ester esterase
MSRNWSKRYMPLSRPVLALVHGWGMNARVFDTLAELLADDFEVRALDLPGHGGREVRVKNTLQSWADDLAQQLPDGATLLGWSLGGQVAMRAALDHPDRISRLILLAATPRFVTDDDWPHAMAKKDLNEFAATLLADIQATLLRFLTLQTRGMEGQKAMLQQLRQTMLAAPQPQQDALFAGLEMLLTTDLRDAVKQLRQPALVLHGALDTLSSPAAGAWLAAALPDTRHVELPRAAHAPHLSHATEVAAGIRRFVHG